MSGKYSDPPDKSAELLRMILPLATRHGSGLHPVSYTVWYEHVSARNPGLTQALAPVIKDGAKLTDAATHDLYMRFVASAEEKATEDAKTGIDKVLGQVTTSIGQSQERAADYGRTLEAWGTELSQEGASPEALRARVAAVLQDTKATSESMNALRSVLEESQREVEFLREQLTRTREEATLDALTGITNRKGFDDALAELTQAALKGAFELSLVMVDIDHFKKLNDTYGHVFGDRVIRGVAQVLKANVKGRDIAARYGGEEFAVLLPETPAKGAYVLAEQVRTQIEKSRIKRLDRDEHVAGITISMGIASYRPNEPLHDFVARADEALYASKQGGRNRVTVK